MVSVSSLTTVLVGSFALVSKRTLHSSRVRADLINGQFRSDIATSFLTGSSSEVLESSELSELYSIL